MTLPDERYRAVKIAREFLQNVANSSGYTRVPSKVRKDAFAILRHFPNEWDMTTAVRLAPEVFQENIEPVQRLIMQYEERRKDAT